MYHVEMRQGLEVVRAFNVDESRLATDFVEPLRSGVNFAYEDHTWIPGDVTLTVLEGPELPIYELGMGLGWGNAQKRSVDVSEGVLQRVRDSAPPRVAAGGEDALTQRLIGRLSAGPMALGDAIRIAGDLMPGRRASEQMAAAETSIWELLRTGGARLEVDGSDVRADQLEQVVLSAGSWLDADRVRVFTR